MVPTGIEVELEETEVKRGRGYQFAVLGTRDAQVRELITRVRQQPEQRVARRYLKPRPGGAGWIVRNDEVVGGLVWASTENSVDRSTRWSTGARSAGASSAAPGTL